MASEPKLRRDAFEIFQAALIAADPAEAVLRHVSVDRDVLIAGQRRYSLAAVQNIYVVGAGKASATMAVAVERLLGKRITSGLINIKHGHKAKLERIRLNECASSSRLLHRDRHVIEKEIDTSGPYLTQSGALTGT